MDERRYSPLHRLSLAILSRGSKKVRGTDWWAVFVEIAIVVLGILIAFQVDAWGDRRSERQAEKVLLQRLAEEARADARALGAIRQQHVDSATNHELLSRAVWDPSLEAGYRRRGTSGCNLLRMPAVRRQSSGAIGQAGGARLELVRDAELRRLLRIAEAQRAFADRQLDFFRAAFLNYGEIVEPYLIFEFGPKGQVPCHVDIPGLRQDTAAVRLLPKLARDHRRFAEYRGQEQDALINVAERVACLSANRCG